MKRRIEEKISKLKSAQEQFEVITEKSKEIPSLNEKIQNLMTELKSKDEKIIDLTLAKDKNYSSIKDRILQIKNENENLSIIINSNHSEISQLK